MLAACFDICRMKPFRLCSFVKTINFYVVIIFTGDGSTCPGPFPISGLAVIF